MTVQVPNDGQTSTQLPVRERLVALVSQHPGLNKSDACRQLAVAWGTLAYHVRMLRAAGLLVAEAHGREVLLFPPASTPQSRLRDRAIRPADAHRILAALGDMRQSGLYDLSRHCNLPPKAVRRHVSSLLAAGFIENHAIGRPRYVLSAKARYELQREPAPETIARFGLQPRVALNPGLQEAAGPELITLALTRSS